MGRKKEDLVKVLGRRLAKTYGPLLEGQVNPVYISYSWGDETPAGIRRQAIVERLQSSLVADGYDVRRDIDQVQYRDSISSFMEEIGAAPCVIAIISDKYLLSEYCMHELVSVWRNNNFTERTVPYVLHGLELSRIPTKISYIQHWAKELASAKEAMDTLPREHLSTDSGVQVQFNQLRHIAQNSDSVIGRLADMNTLTPEQLEFNDFAIVKTAIKSALTLP